MSRSTSNDFPASELIIIFSIISLNNCSACFTVEMPPPYAIGMNASWAMSFNVVKFGTGPFLGRGDVQDRNLIDFFAENAYR